MPHIKTPTQQPPHLTETLLHGDSDLGHKETTSILRKVDAWFSWKLLPFNQTTTLLPNVIVIKDAKTS